jgi:GDP-4-dehydro-6-deoxy-D-mannose reductase
MTANLSNDDNNGKRVVVFGSGFIASNFARYARDKLGWMVRVVYRRYENPQLSGFHLSRLPESSGEVAAFLEDWAPTEVVIAVGSSFVPAINRDIGSALEAHVNATLFILNALVALRRHQVSKILIVGSASEYGVFGEHSVDETHPTQPQDAYGVIKLAQYHVGRYYLTVHGLPVVHVRQFNVTGVGQDLRFVIPSICSQATRLRALTGTQDDAQRRLVVGNIHVRRDFLSIDDVVEAYRCLLMCGSPGEAYNVCSGVTHSIEELIRIIGKAVGIDFEMDVDQELVRESDKVKSVICGNPGKLKALGWAPARTIEAIIDSMLAYHAADLETKGNPLLPA